MKIENMTQLRSGMIFNAGHGVYMIVSNDIDPTDKDWKDHSRWVVVWFLNSKNAPEAPGMTFHMGHNDRARDLGSMFVWIEQDDLIGNIDRDIVKEMITTAGYVA